MNIIKRELKANLKSLIIWSISIIALILVWMSEFSALADNKEIELLMKSFPQALLNVLGIWDTDFTTLGGFITVISVYLFLILGIHGALIGNSLISKEERDKTSEFLFTRPVSRIKVVKDKIIAGIINLLVLNLVLILSILFSSISYIKLAGFYRFIFLFSIGMFLFQLIYFSLGMFLAAFMKRYKKSGNLSISVLMITYILSILINMTDKIDFLKCITPFEYFRASDILKQGKIQPLYLILSFIIITIFISGTFKYYKSRDLYI